MGATESIEFMEVVVKNVKYGPKVTRGYSLCVVEGTHTCLLFGGAPGNCSEVYQLRLDNYRWNTLACRGIVPTARMDHSAVFYNEDMIIAFGQDQYGNNLDSIFSLSCTSGSREWTQCNNCTGEFPVARSGHTAVVYKNKMILFGGQRGKESYQKLNDCFSLDLDTMQWKQIVYTNRNLPKPRSHHGAAVFGNKMIIFGGQTKSGRSNSCWFLDLETAEWTKIRYKQKKKSAIPPAMRRPSCFVHGGCFFVASGIIGDEKPVCDLYVMRFDEQFFIKVTDPKLSKSGNLFSALLYEEKLILVGGIFNSHLLDSVYETDLDAHQKVMNVPVNELSFLKQISDLEFRKVYRGKWRGEDVIIKVLRSPSDKDDVQNAIEKFRREIDTLRKLHHPNIIGFRCVSYKHPNLCMATEYCHNGTLAHVLENVTDFPKISFDRAVDMAFDIARGMAHIYSKQVVHGTLTPAHLLVTSALKIKISDFFLSAKPYEDVKTSQHSCTYYEAPEVISGATANELSDVYSFGIIIWELYFRKLPYDGAKDLLSIALKVQNDKLRPSSDHDLEQVKESFPAHDDTRDRHVAYLDLIKSCWSHDPKNRPTFSEIVKLVRDLTERRSIALSFSSSISSSSISNIRKFTQTAQQEDKYEILKLIGSGSQAKVFKVKERITGLFYALKKYKTQPFSEINLVFMELRAYVNMNHKNVIRIHDFFITEMDNETNCVFNIVMEYCDGGSLEELISNYVQQKKQIPHQRIAKILTDLFEGLDYLHSHHIMHRDMKPQNCFIIKDSGELKIGDLGLAIHALGVDREQKREIAGTLAYMSPEMRNSLDYDNSVDIWACGVICFELITLKSFNFKQMMMQGNFYLEEMLSVITNPDYGLFVEICKNCLNVDPHRRPSPKFCLNWLDPSRTAELASTAESVSPSELEASSDRFEQQHDIPTVSLQNSGTCSFSGRSFNSASIRSTDHSSIPLSEILEEEDTYTNVTTMDQSIRHSPSYLGTRFDKLRNLLNYANVMNWSVVDVANFMEQVMEYPQYVPLIHSHELNGEALLELTTVADLQHLGLTKLGHILLILKYIKKLRT